MAAFMLDACGLDSSDFYDDERVLTRENFEKNYQFLERMVQTRQRKKGFIKRWEDPSRTPYFVIGYFALLTGGKISEKLRQRILEAAKWEYEDGYWTEEGFALKRQIYLEDFREKIKILRSGQKLHTAIFKYPEEDFLNSKVVVGVNQLKDYYNHGKLSNIHHVNLDGWGLKSIPKEVFELSSLKSLSLSHNSLREISDELSNLTSLESLYLDYNLFKSYPEPIGVLISLNSLNISHNEICSLPEPIGMMSSLKSLNISYNDISSLPKSIRNLRQLKSIDLGGTNITHAPKFLKNAQLDKYTQRLYI
jgi:hypothetical protein